MTEKSTLIRFDRFYISMAFFEWCRSTRMWPPRVTVYPLLCLGVACAVDCPCEHSWRGLLWSCTKARHEKVITSLDTRPTVNNSYSLESLISRTHELAHPGVLPAAVIYDYTPPRWNPTPLLMQRNADTVFLGVRRYTRAPLSSPLKGAFISECEPIYY